MVRLVTCITIIAAFYHIVVVGGVFTFFGVFISPLIHRAISLTFALILLYLLFPARANKTKEGNIAWYDIGLILCGIIPLGFSIGFQDQILDYSLYGILDFKGTVFAFALMATLLEACRRASGSLVLPGLLLLSFLITIYNNYMPGVFHGMGFSLNEIGLILYVSPHGFFGIPLRVASTIVIMFMVFSQILRATGGSDWLINLALSLVGRSKGGPAKASIVASALFGTISGSPSSNSAATGIVTIPLMKRIGYTPEFAGAVEATASTGGQILPPVMGAVAFVIAEWLEIRYVDVLAGALVPALLYFTILFYGVDIRARQSNLQAMPEGELEPFLQVIKRGWFYVLPVATLVYLLVFLQFPPETSALSAIVVMFGMGIFIDKDRKRLSLPSFRDAYLRLKEMIFSMGDGIRLWLKVAIICAAVGIIVGCFTQSGVGLKTAAYIVEISRGNLIFVLLLAAFSAYVLGMGMDTLPLYVTMAILVAPALDELGVNPLSAHLFVLFWGLTSHITPPVCLAVYVTSAIAESNIWKTGLQAMRLGIVLFVIPFAFVYYPGLHLAGSITVILQDTIRTLVASAGIVGGLTGFLGKQTSWVQRILLMCGGVILLIPKQHSWILGTIMIAAIGLWQWLPRLRTSR